LDVANDDGMKKRELGKSARSNIRCNQRFVFDSTISRVSQKIIFFSTMH